MAEDFIEEDIRLVDIVDSIGSYFKYLLRKFYIVIIGLGGFTYLGYLYASKAPPEYISFTSFNSIDAKGIATSGLMSIASSLGLGAGGGATVDVLTGVYQSRNVFLSALVSDVEVDGKTDKLANYCMKIYGLDAGFKETKGKENFRFTTSDKNLLTPDEDSIANILYSYFIEEILEIEYEVTAGLVYANITTPDEQLSKLLGSKIIEKTVDYYKDQQIESSSISFKTINTRIDSLASEIKFREHQLAKLQDVNIFNTKRQGIEGQDDIRMQLTYLRTMYSDALVTKESAKVGLKPEGSSVRVVDHPSFSTFPSYKSELLWSLIGFAVGFVLVIIPLLIRKAVSDGREEDKRRQQIATV